MNEFDIGNYCNAANLSGRDLICLEHYYVIRNEKSEGVKKINNFHLIGY